MIRDNEQEHGDALTATVEKLGGSPSGRRPHFDAVIAGGANKILETAAVVENLGAAAYLGQAGRIESKEVRPLWRSIRSRVGMPRRSTPWWAGPFVPDGAFAKPASMEEVLPMVKPFLA